MRVTNGMMVNNLKRNLNTNMENLDKLQQQMSTGRKINKPSDDPAGLVKSLRLRTNLTEGEQYQANIGEASSFMEATDAALLNVDEVMQRVRELTVKAATGTNDASANRAIADEISQLNNQLETIANSAYGSKYIFAGTNVTEAPYQEGEWTGNDQALQLEIGQGVKLPINTTEMKEFFTGRLNDLDKYVPNSVIRNITANNLQEGKYDIKTDIETGAFDAAATETQSYLGSISNNGHFFYQDARTVATLGAGTANLANDSAYNGSLLIEVKDINTGVEQGAPRVTLTDPTVDSPIMQFDQPLYIKDASGSLIQISSNDLAPNFTYTQASGSSGSISSASYNDATGEVSFSIAGLPATGDTIVWNNNSAQGKVYSKDGKEYVPVKALFDGTNWVYDDSSRITADIKGHVYTSDGDYQYVELKNVEINMETKNGQQLFKISAADLDNSNFPDDLVIWNNSGAALGGIDPTNPQIKVGDKTVISLAGAGQLATNYQKIEADYTYTDVNGKQIGDGQHSFVFDENFFDNQARELKFFTINEETGLSYDGNMTVEGGTFAKSDKVASFTYQAGIFGYMEDLVRKVETGKLPQVGDELAGNDLRLNELLTRRSTIGAKVNRLELQKNRLESTQDQFTALLAQTEDVNEAEVIMNLKMQENVYQASLSAGARIIQPTLVDFLS
ncbi:MAG: flagellar hook-associated protein FlgL [Syntrophomonas sp.]